MYTEENSTISEEIFKSAHEEPVEINHSNLGKFELINSHNVDGLAWVATNILCGHAVLCDVEGGYAWLEPQDAPEQYKEKAGIASRIQDDGASITDEGMDRIMTFIGVVFKTKIMAVDEMLARFYGF